MIPTSHAALADLLQTIGLNVNSGGGGVTIDGSDPVVASPHRLSAASAVALAAQGIAAAALWRERAGEGQDVAVDTRDALNALNSTFFLRQNGRRMGIGVVPHEPMSPFFQVRNGWFKLVGSRHVLRDKTLKLLNCMNATDSIAAAVANWDGLALEDACEEAGLAGCFVRTSEQWRSHPQGQWLARQPVVRVEKLGDSEPRPLPRGNRPLAGLRVLEAAHILAGSAASRTLAEHGAEVLRVSHPVGQQDPPYMVIDTGFGKRNTFLDLDGGGRPNCLHALGRWRRRVRGVLPLWRSRPARRGRPGTGVGLPGARPCFRELLWRRAVGLAPRL